MQRGEQHHELSRSNLEESWSFCEGGLPTDISSFDANFKISLSIAEIRSRLIQKTSVSRETPPKR